MLTQNMWVIIKQTTKQKQTNERTKGRVSLLICFFLFVCVLLCRRVTGRVSSERRAFSVARPTSWNSLPDRLRDPTHESWQFSKKNYFRITFELLNTLQAQ